jgi:hypothetical protein
LGFKFDKATDTPETYAERNYCNFPDGAGYSSGQIAMFKSHATHREITLDALLKELSPKPDITIELNSEYKAIVSADKVKVGCQTFPISKVAEILKAAESLRD